MERNEFQTRTKLEAQIASTERELALAKKKLEHEEEERDKRREAWEQRVIYLHTQCIVLLHARTMIKFYKAEYIASICKFINTP